MVLNDTTKTTQQGNRDSANSTVNSIPTVAGDNQGISVAQEVSSIFIHYQKIYTHVLHCNLNVL